MTDIVFAHDGTVAKIVGDALHILFGAPGEQPESTLTAQFLARWRWMSMPNHSANAGSKRALLWGLHASELMPGPQSSAISAEAVSSTIRLMATPLTWRVAVKVANKQLGTRIFGQFSSRR